MRAGPVQSLLLLLCLLGAGIAQGQEPPSVPKDLEARASTVDREITVLQERIEALRPGEYIFNVESRIVDADLHFELKQFEAAARLYTSLIIDTRFAQHPGYWRAVRQLGISFYQMGNYLGAYRQFERCFDAGKDSESSLGFMIEIAAKLGRYEDLRRLADRIGVAASPALRYAKGKALYLSGDFAGADAVLSVMPQGDADTKRAFYLHGSALVGLGKTREAFDRFKSILALPPSQTEAELEVDELTYMALGRLMYHFGEYSRAIDYYQEISRASNHYERTLFEIINTYLQWTKAMDTEQGRFDRLRWASDLLVTLSDVAKDPEVLRKALVLSGRVAMYLERWDEADEAFDKVIAQFQRASQELTDLVNDGAQVDRFFDSLVKGSVSGEANGLVSKDVVLWLSRQPSLGRVMALLGDLAAQEDELTEAEAIYQTIKYVLDNSGGVPMLAGYGELWSSSLELEMRLLDLGVAHFEVSRTATKAKLTPSLEGEAERLDKARRGLREQLRNTPRDTPGFEKRQDAKRDRIGTLAQETYAQYLALLAQKEQVVALERLMKDARYSGSAFASVESEKEVRGELERLGKEIAKVTEIARTLRNQIDAELSVEDASVLSTRREDDVKAALWRHLDEESAFYKTTQRELSGTPAGLVQASTDRHAESRRVMQRLLAARQALRTKSSQLALALGKTLAEERRELDSRKAALAETQRAGLLFAKQVGVTLLVKAKEEMVRSVVEADLGKVDLLWLKKSAVTRQVRVVNDSRIAATKYLVDELDAIEAEENLERELAQAVIREGDVFDGLVDEPQNFMPMEPLEDPPPGEFDRLLDPVDAPPDPDAPSGSGAATSTKGTEPGAEASQTAPDAVTEPQPGRLAQPPPEGDMQPVPQPGPTGEEAAPGGAAVPQPTPDGEETTPGGNETTPESGSGTGDDGNGSEPGSSSGGEDAPLVPEE